MKRLIAILLSMFLMSALAQNKRDFIAVPRLQVRDEIGPLILDSIAPTNQWICVTWQKDYPAHGRRIGGKVPDERLPLTFLNIQLAYISPAHSSDPKQNEIFNQIYLEGVRTLLANDRHFWFEVTEDSYAGPGQIGGVFILDYWGGTTLQYEMVRCGYAVVDDSNGWPMVEKYRSDYRDSLLRTEGMARAWNLGLWAKIK